MGPCGGKHLGLDGLELDGLGAANFGPKHVGGSHVASLGHAGVQGDPGDCLWPILGSHPEGLWLSAITELPPLQLLVEMVSDLCQ